MSAYLFVYGTLREGAGHPMHKVLSAGADAVGPAIYQGKLFDLGPYPGVVPDPAGRCWVVGETYRMNAPELLLRSLDEYEGCAPHAPQPHQYRRALQPIRSENGKQGEAWIYLYIAALNGARQIDSGDYLHWKTSQLASSLPDGGDPCRGC